MLMKRPKTELVSNFKELIYQAKKNDNIPRLNDISEAILDIVSQYHAFRIHNRHLENIEIYKETSDLIDLYSQLLKLIKRLEFRS